jgi:hypothetical protein
MDKLSIVGQLARLEEAYACQIPNEGASGPSLTSGR